MNKFKGVFLIIAFIAASGMVTMAFASDGWRGRDYDEGYGGYGMGPGMMGYGYGMGPGMMGDGYGMGPGMMGYGYGMGPGMMGYGPGYGYYGRGDYAPDLSKDDIIKLQRAQDKFFDETHTLRNEIRDKQLALNDELNSANPNKDKVADLQKALSSLQADYDQKALSYRLALRKLLPERAGQRDHAYGYGPGYGGYNW